MATGCEKQIRPGQVCDITSLGRCANCGDAFCLTHQARTNSTSYTNLCSFCYPEYSERQRLALIQESLAREEQAKQLAEWREQELSKIKARISANARRLVQYGSPGLQPRSATVQEVKKHGRGKKSYEGWTGRYVEISLPTAWPVGSLSWTRRVHHTGGWGRDDWETKRSPVSFYVTTAGTVESNAEMPTSEDLDVWRKIDEAFTALVKCLLG